MKTYYHGTSYYSAYRILSEGFRIVKYFGGGGVKGPGIYVTDNLDYAYDMARGKAWVLENRKNKPCMIKCELKHTSPIFWTDKEYDPKIINYLKKEFNKRIVDSNYDVKKFIPRNKHLTRTEVINLINYWAVQEQKERDKAYKNKPNTWAFYKERGDSSYLENVRHLLSRHGYAGWGQYTHDCWDSDEIVIFNPSEVIPVKVYNVEGDYDEEEHFYTSTKLGEEVSMDNLRLGYEEEFESLKKDDETYKENSIGEMYK